MISGLDAGDDGANRAQFTAYLRALKWIDADKEPENLALCYVPTSLGDFERLQAGLGQFALDGTATPPYAAHGLDATKLPTPNAKASPTPAGAPVWASFVIPVGKPAERYPDGKLKDGMKGAQLGELKADILEQLWATYVPKTEVEFNGKIVPTTPALLKSQTDLRAMLDLAGRDLSFKAPKEVA
jgi:hypothetical protein